MTAVIKLVIATMIGLLFTSCSMNFGVRGNGIVQTTERTVNGTFDEIQISRGLDVYLTQSDLQTISIQADENLHDIIKTEIEGNVLKIYADENISYSEAQKVMVSFNNISRISAASGSDVYSTNTFNLESLKLEGASGSDMTLDLNTQTIDCNSSSGSDLKLSGTTVNFVADASSGSDINAGNLKAETSRVNASSGADITVNTSKELQASASSGGDIKYLGNPEKIEKTDGVSGSINEG
ncbi:MAG: head GIN domain-containing protein [Aquaticitalea sp.]